MISGNQNSKSSKRFPPQGPGNSSKYQGSGSKVRGDSRSQNRKPTQDLSLGRKDGSLNRKQKGQAVPQKTREEIEAETAELNYNAKDVYQAYQTIAKIWEDRDVPLQHRVAFIESVKVLDMKMMAQIFEKEVQDFANGQAPVLNCMEIVKQREACLHEINRLNETLSDQRQQVSDENYN